MWQIDSIPKYPKFQNWWQVGLIFYDQSFHLDSISIHTVCTFDAGKTMASNHLIPRGDFPRGPCIHICINGAEEGEKPGPHQRVRMFILTREKKAKQTSDELRQRPRPTFATGYDTLSCPVLSNPWKYRRYKLGLLCSQQLFHVFYFSVCLYGDFCLPIL